MEAINILGNDGLDDESFETTYRDFKVVQHLFFVPCILNLTEPYMDDDSIGDLSSDSLNLYPDNINSTSELAAPTPPIPLQRIQLSVQSDSPHKRGH